MLFPQNWKYYCPLETSLIGADMKISHYTAKKN